MAGPGHKLPSWYPCRSELGSEYPILSPGYRYVILDIPLLFETKKLLKYMKHTVVVYW